MGRKRLQELYEICFTSAAGTPAAVKTSRIMREAIEWPMGLASQRLGLDLVATALAGNTKDGYSSFVAKSTSNWKVGLPNQDGMGTAHLKAVLWPLRFALPLRHMPWT